MKKKLFITLLIISALILICSIYYISENRINVEMHIDFEKSSVDHEEYVNNGVDDSIYEAYNVVCTIDNKTTRKILGCDITNTVKNDDFIITKNRTGAPYWTTAHSTQEIPMTFYFNKNLSNDDIRSLLENYPINLKLETSYYLHAESAPNGISIIDDIKNMIFKTEFECKNIVVNCNADAV